MPTPLVRFPLAAAFVATLALVRPAQAHAQASVQGAVIFAALDGGSFTTGLSGPGVEGTVLFHTFLFDITAGAQFIDYGSVNVFGLVIEPRLLLPDTERVKPYVGLRGIAARFSYPHALGTATGTGSEFSIGFGAKLGLSRRIAVDVAYHYLVNARFGTSRVDGTAVDGSPITGHGGGLQLRIAVSMTLGKR
jgi:hypothetical protein